MFSPKSTPAMRGMASRCAASDTMPVAITMAKYAGDRLRTAGRNLAGTKDIRPAKYRATASTRRA